jgi:hypothetical protein
MSSCCASEHSSHPHPSIAFIRAHPLPPTSLCSFLYLTLTSIIGRLDSKLHYPWDPATVIFDRTLFVSKPNLWTSRPITPSVSTCPRESHFHFTHQILRNVPAQHKRRNTPAFVATGPVHSITRCARAQTVPLYARISQDERVWNSSYQLACPVPHHQHQFVLSSSPTPTPTGTTVRYHIADAAKKTPRMRAAIKQAMKKRLLGKKRFNPAIQIRVDTEVTEVIEVDNLVDTTPGDFLLDTPSSWTRQSRGDFALEGGIVSRTVTRGL